jgi:D-alanyl-D-alanine carboxypeptidase/D-alanyl-D-alanine-endopeptidase (penicillin-binding protein 4)
MARSTPRHITLLALVCALVAAPPATAAGPASTASALQRQMRLASAASGALAVDLDTGQTLFSVRADTPRMPASVEKLYTTSTALLRLGPEERLTTTALGETAIDADGTLAGNLYLRGSGDPTFGAPEASRLAGALKAAGLRRVSGRVFGDESAFDGRRGPPSSGYRLTSEVGPLSALSFDQGRTGVRHPYFQVSPALFTAQAFQRALRRRGISVAGKAGTGDTPEDAVPLGEWSSPPLAEIARRTNVPSNNYMAEMLVKVLGVRLRSEGSTAAGAGAIHDAMASLGVSTQVVDGSGLSRLDRTSPAAVVTLLRRMAADPAASALDASLPVAGRTGTLQHRMRGTAAQDRCHAKTGTLHDVSALAGYCTTTGGAHVAFAFLMNYTSYVSARRVQDRMTAALARYAPAG